MAPVDSGAASGTAVEPTTDAAGRGPMADEQAPGSELDAVAIQRIIPHRYPFLLVDRVVDLEPGKRAVGIKNVTMGDHFFQGHFPDYPVMPGVLIVEALAQVGAVALGSSEEFKGKLALFAGI